MKYYVVNTENRRVLFGPFEREAANIKHYDVCANGIPNQETGVSIHPRCAVVCEEALTPNDLGNHYCQDMKEDNRVAA